MNEFELNNLKLTPSDNQLFFLLLLIHVSRRQQKSDLKIDLCPSYLLAKHYEIHGKWIVAQKYVKSRSTFLCILWINKYLFQSQYVVILLCYNPLQL